MLAPALCGLQQTRGGSGAAYREAHGQPGVGAPACPRAVEVSSAAHRPKRASPDHLSRRRPLDAAQIVALSPDGAGRKSRMNRCRISTPCSAVPKWRSASSIRLHSRRPFVPPVPGCQYKTWRFPQRDSIRPAQARSVLTRLHLRSSWPIRLFFRPNPKNQNPRVGISAPPHCNVANPYPPPRGA